MTKKRGLMLMKAENLIYQNHSFLYFRRNKSSISTQIFVSFCKKKDFLSILTLVASYHYQVSQYHEYWKMKLILLLAFTTYFFPPSDGNPYPYETMTVEDRGCPSSNGNHKFIQNQYFSSRATICKMI